MRTRDDLTTDRDENGSADALSPAWRAQRSDEAREPGETADNELASRLRAEAAARRGIEDAEAVAAALDVVERAAAQVSRATLHRFAERLGRAYARALNRLRAEERHHVRAAVKVMEDAS